MKELNKKLKWCTNKNFSNEELLLEYTYEEEEMGDKINEIIKYLNDAETASNHSQISVPAQKFYILIGNYDLKNSMQTQIFDNLGKALEYVKNTIIKHWNLLNFICDINYFNLDYKYQILVTDSNEELIATYYIVEREIVN